MKHFESIHKLLSYIDLDSDLDNFDRIHEAIKKDLIFKGTNIWILVFAIIVASVGLNINSTAVIIGAMLISPLMGPINGMGYSLATYNFPLFRKALKHFSFAVLASLVASTAYFSISPISTAHSELLARTSPTIYDVLIALFGGLAGIVAISSRHKGNVIPGVAIATALMPPLCTAGYGLATGHFDFFFGAIYLFTINTVFIAISSVVISQILKFPIRTLVDDLQKKKVNRWISATIILVLIPSIYFGYNLVEKERFMENATKYIENISVVDGNYLLKNKINPNKKSIMLVYGGATLSQIQKKNILEKARNFSLKDAKIEFVQGFSFDAITMKNTEVDKMNIELSRIKMMLKGKEEQLDSTQNRSFLGRQILDEIHNIFPQIINCAYTESFVYKNNEPKPEKVVIVIFKTNLKYFKSSDKKKVENWLITKLNTKSLKVFYEY